MWLVGRSIAEVRTVGRQEEQLGAVCADRSTHRGSFVAAEIVHHYDVASAQARRQELRDVGEEAEAVDRPVENTGRGDPVVPQSGDEGQRLPMTMRHFVHQGWPTAHRPCLRVMLVLAQVSSM